MFKLTRSMVALLALLSQSLHAYEDDVHYGLTKWLALQAPLSPLEAEWLASETVSYDHSVLSAPHLVLHYACRKTDAKASRLVQENHFPGEGVVPGKPSLRIVFPGSKEARRKSDDRIAHPGSVMESNIRVFGEGLHPLEDSWSHQGEPDPPWRLLCDPNYSWGHPKARGGWRSHKADLTADYPSDAMAMAATTYDQICAFTKNVLHRSCTQSFPGSDVDAFVRARTKAEKENWFLSHGFTDTAFLDAISLPNGARYGQSAKPAGSAEKPVANQDDSDKQGEAEEKAFMHEFFAQWATAENLNAVAAKFADEKSIRYISDGTDANEQIDRETLAALMTLWRVRDHGGIAEPVHDLQLLRKVGIGQVLRSTQELSQPYISVVDAFLPLNKSGMRIDVARDQRGDSVYAYGLARFRHAPYDTIVVVARKQGGRYLVTSVAGIVEH